MPADPYSILPVAPASFLTMNAASPHIRDIVTELRTAFTAGTTRSLAWRRHQLQQLQALLVEQEDELLAALAADLGKPALEAYAGELALLKRDIKHTLQRFTRWCKPQKVATPSFNFHGTSWVTHQPRGVVCIIGPWNYPLQLLLSPLIGAVAAGNCCLLKPSEIAAETSALLATLLPKYLDTSCIRVFEGGVAETTELLAQPFDYLFFTGSTRVGKVVMQAAAQHLTPVTLELGGKSPAVIDQNCNLRVAAKRLTWGKFFNAGQTCIAPDYLLVHRSQREPLLAAIKQTIAEFYGDPVKASPDYARIVTQQHMERLIPFLRDGEVVIGGQYDIDQRFLAPTVLKDVSHDAPVMQEEIFGPILPVLTVESLDEAIDFVNARPHPLALYVFTNEASRAQQVLEHTHSGGACVNDTIAHTTTSELPFGGVGESGIGAYHGRFTYDTFSHRKSVFKRSTWMDPSIRYPPYSAQALAWLRRLIG